METIFGNIQGLKSSQLKQLQRLYHQRISGDCITTSEFAQRLAAVSTEINQPICTYINRRGQVIRVGVGSPRQTQIPPLELPRYGAERLSGIRCLSTNLKSEPPNEADLTAMALQRLDALVVFNITGGGFTKRGGGATGYVKEAYLAHLVANNRQLVVTQSASTSIPNTDTYSHISPPLSLDALADQGFLELVESLEAEFSREYVAQEVDADHDRVVIVGVLTDNTSPQQFQDIIAELARLVDTAGGDVLQTLQQKRSRIHPQTVIGEGKVQEVALTAQTLGANLVVFDRDLSPSQVRNLEAQIGVRVVDRTEVILDIFAQRAQSGAGKLQVELAQLEYMLPRLTGRGQAMSRLGGGIGTRGPGETKLETERRAIQKRISRLQQEVNQLQAHRCRLRQRRQHREVPSVALVGYTNAGKSTLLNALTNSEVYTADQLFATLDPTTRRLMLPHAETGVIQETLMTDTVGFIHELPSSLMDAFRATLEEVTEADALLHLVDLSHPAWLSHIRSVRDILAQMPITPGPALVAFNKIDQVSSETLALAREEFPLAIFISASQRLGMETLRQRLSLLIQYAVDGG
ncbi:GTPase HflX [Aphanizomenon flos-aquae NRERC-008]|uniref:GTPase HflX n=1 Tax=Aphanizomenon flos-aquae FACHB-1249 TaxID=2692889 RepID=A0ABR8IKA4_APHFL|nr:MULTISPECIES: GTPase HflX [Aphanizomenon]MBD2388932.1 GTPase HflX [Aphanizomenon flos-aquae FACHB-1171]MBD2555540.1 GTPase HflX [Aphanizomenon flos-aquae FACHB-1290]MBD2629945.1 GTPase HflX [Aphanizomenon sp. FACHB-1399]MBD2655906.1 GTPase HflX [Aphanizomenon flos-aquae FACHB-1265]MBD2673852.1 GTPase HflX [Aphanizomenon flos-aquae FACHB-1416]MBD2683701.1 GTPase HflX [Aphanizomenon flos-aquae FACHB-1249]MDJ0504708.1 GTPase HflX [Nostocales cyanobacterium LE14-WE12]